VSDAHWIATILKDEKLLSEWIIGAGGVAALKPRTFCKERRSPKPEQERIAYL
jgi:hypothetical protein